MTNNYSLFNPAPMQAAGLLLPETPQEQNLKRQQRIAEYEQREMIRKQKEQAMIEEAKKFWQSLNPAQKVGMSPIGFPFTDAIGLAGDVQMYKENPEMRSAGNYAMSGLGLLPFVPGVASTVMKNTPNARLQRAKEMGFDTDNRVFHGTTHDIKAFDPSKGNIEGRYGDAIYFTDSPIDTSKNYAGVGPDLTSRIFSRQEQLINDWASGASNKKMEPFKGAKKYGKDLNIKPEDFDDMDQYFMAIARKELSGGADNVIPAYLKMENPIDLTNKNKGWELITEYDEAGDYVDETGNAIDLYESIMRVANKYDFDGQKLFNDLELYDYKSFREVDDAIRASDEMLDVADDAGNYASNQVIKEIYQDAGFDGVIMDASDTFKNMKNIPDDTKHFIVFEPNQVRSTSAKFDPNKAQSAGLLAGTGALAVGSRLLKEEENAN